MDHAAGAFKANHHLVARFCRRQNGGDLFAQAADFVGIHTAFKIQHPGARFSVRLGGSQLCPRLCRFCFLLELFLLRFMPQLLLRPIEQRSRQLFLHLLILLAKIGYPQLAALFFALSQVNNNGDDNRNCDNDGRDFGQKQAILSK